MASAHTIDQDVAAFPVDDWLRHSADFWLAAAAIAIPTVLYGVGWLRLRERAAAQVPHVRHAILFALGAAALWVALLTRLDALGGELFSAHMIQHETLMLVAAPLLVLGRPLPVFLWAFPARARQTIAGIVRSVAFARCWSAVSRPVVAWTLHATALWLWHAPLLFGAALANPAIHDLQHLSFLVTALIFWSALSGSRREGGVAVLYLFTTTVHTSVLGALLTFATHPLYEAYLATAPHWNLTALEDQQLGGLILWVPGSRVYAGLALVLLSRWLSAPGPSLSGLGAPRSSPTMRMRQQPWPGPVASPGGLSAPDRRRAASSAS
jgi:cytochrome c oxidase assembly factor CtaG